ncbi:hypothetical protein TRFO_36584 [Tritrichomonas foetus]|uniref:Uncharacterized protein n=1 Tax=Tritrichomonas foetus TaxID=1144522 RepID=A0A1J4JG05_9EUKA|nr:hypothetical protein TRFO_36584 [Tritrichomonas foetus]|eukprot:OHS97231.1 hypothetical protein TRFO_36584 [Tritrichomonas foetus]
MKSQEFHKSFLDTCFGEDGSRIRPKIPIFISSFYLFYIFQFYIIFCSSRWSQKLIEFVIYQGSYYSFSHLGYFLKAHINDFNCSTHPNSISGHTFYHLFFYVTFYVTYHHSKKAKSTLHKLSYYICQILHLVNLSLTYLGGYHTPRQIIAGAIFGIIVLIFTFLLKKYCSLRMNIFVYFLNMTISIYLAHNFCGYTPSFELLTGPGFLWYFLAVIALYLDKNNKKKLE